ncbi:MAG TPA: DUF4936 family protein [Burkholderiaceae bacterium]|jgi:hypothetical protein|nr:DUF4936 family protein [Burkholderiaceae bacterium]HPE00841.1 DUF4936 family protein [Burkholderiaceae bacterium]HRZ01028.1 DUF4936 family protein [Burkholderiaceae bacterium]
MEHWFIYYKLPAAELAAVAERVRVMQGALAAATGVHGRLARRTDAAEPLTLMEIYERIPDPTRFGAALTDAAAHAGLPAALLDARRIERFAEV